MILLAKNINKTVKKPEESSRQFLDFESFFYF